MRYAKPYVVVMGQSASLIETKTNNKVGNVGDGTGTHSDGAYEVDE